VLVGVVTDPIFGPLLVCGMGGVLAELLGDVSYRLTPVTDVDAAEMIATLRMARLLDGYRAPADREALAVLLVSARGGDPGIARDGFNRSRWRPTRGSGRA
jgi:hypothetical protein